MRIPYNEDDVTEVYSGACRETNEEELAGHPQSAATKKKISKAMTGKGNSQYKHGQRSYRNKMGLKDGDKRVVHHKDGDRGNNAASNLVITTKAKNDKIHHREDNFQRSGGRKPKSTTHKSRIRK